MKHVSEVAISLANVSRGASLPATVSSDLTLARKVVGVLQHHDSITGTSKPTVTDNLDVRLHASISASLRVLDAATHRHSASASKATVASAVGPAPFGSSPVLLDLDQARHEREAVGSQRSGQWLEQLREVRPGQTISLFNALLHERVNETIVLNLNPTAAHSRLAVIDVTTGTAVPSLIVPPVPMPVAFVLATNATQLIFQATVGPLSTASYKLVDEASTLIPASGPPTSPASWDCSPTAPRTLSTDLIRVSFGASRRLAHLSARSNRSAAWLPLTIEQVRATLHVRTARPLPAPRLPLPALPTCELPVCRMLPNHHSAGLCCLPFDS